MRPSEGEGDWLSCRTFWVLLHCLHDRMLDTIQPLADWLDPISYSGDSRVPDTSIDRVSSTCGVTSDPSAVEVELTRPSVVARLFALSLPPFFASCSIIFMSSQPSLLIPLSPQTRDQFSLESSWCNIRKSRVDLSRPFQTRTSICERPGSIVSIHSS